MNGYTVAGLFAGIGGIELGLRAAGHTTELLCEIDPAASAVLKRRFSEIPLQADVTKLGSLPAVDVVAAGFPCQDLSQAGRTVGITGSRSGLVGEVFSLIAKGPRPRWLILENVPFMLQLDAGRAMDYLVTQLEELGFMWAYRIVDTRAFGLPQRRLRVILLASATDDPRTVLFADEAGDHAPQDHAGRASGFYWTEGTRGLGWAPDAVPTLKGGSTIGIASPPAIWFPDGKLAMPSVEDGERLQGFRAGWTSPAVGMRGTRAGVRWKLVGNAVSVPVSCWVGRRLAAPGEILEVDEERLSERHRWPAAAWGRAGERSAVQLSAWPVRKRYHHLEDFLRHPVVPLSARAAEGFYRRALGSKLRFPEGLLDAVAAHLRSGETAGAAA